MASCENLCSAYANRLRWADRMGFSSWRLNKDCHEEAIIEFMIIVLDTIMTEAQVIQHFNGSVCWPTHCFLPTSH
jgi:hypothetical protein